MTSRLFQIAVLFFITLACQPQEGSLIDFTSHLAVENGNRFLVIGSQDNAHRGFAIYTIEGEFIRGGHFKDEGSTPRGLASFDNESFLVATDSVDSIYHVDLLGNKSIFHGSNFFNGNIYELEVAPNGNIYAIESNRIEVFSPLGHRLGAEYINTTTGACSLSVPRGMTFNYDGQLVVSDRTNGRINIYDISTVPATCVSSVYFGNRPHGIVAHSDGYLYIATEQDHRIYRANPDGSNPEIIWETDTNILNRPQGMIELPNGDLLVSSGAGDSLERVTTSGVRVGLTPFLRDIYTRNVSDMAIVGGNSE